MKPIEISISTHCQKALAFALTLSKNGDVEEILFDVIMWKSLNKITWSGWGEMCVVIVA